MELIASKIRCSSDKQIIWFFLNIFLFNWTISDIFKADDISIFLFSLLCLVESLLQVSKRDSTTLEK